MEKVHQTLIRVRYAETDAMGVAHHAAYLVWFEEARTELCREAGAPYREMEARGILLPVIDIACRYRKPLYYDDAVVIRTSIIGLTRRSIRVCYEVRRGNEPCAEGETYHLVTDRTTRRVATFPPDTLAALGRWAPTAQVPRSASRSGTQIDRD